MGPVHLFAGAVLGYMELYQRFAEEVLSLSGEQHLAFRGITVNCCWRTTALGHVELMSTVSLSGY
jgi:DNA-directed RNA polymerase subunit N (RpoN/RPB10)